MDIYKTIYNVWLSKKFNIKKIVLGTWRRYLQVAD